MKENDDKKYRLAQKRVKKKKEFYAHFGTYVISSLFFILLNAATSWGNWWFQWPVMGWGLAVGFQYIEIFGFPGMRKTEAEWEDRAMEEEMKRLDTEYPAYDEEEDHLDLKEVEKPPKKNWDEDELV